MRKNTTKAKLKAGQSVFGVVLKIPAPAVVELCAHAGFDFVLIDVEEGPSNELILEDLVRAAEATGITPMVRVQSLDSKVISRALDTGALGVQIPHVITKEQALAVVRYAKYYPEGMRGIGGVRAADFGMTMPLDEYIKEANSEVMIVAMIEDREGVENLDEILQVQGIDAICIGPSDLSQSLGLPAQVGHPKVQETVEHVIAKAVRSGKVAGIPGVNIETTKRYLRQGARYVAIGAEGLLVKAAREYLAGVR